MTDYTMADYLQGRNAPNLLMPYAPPPNRPRTHGKGSVQDIALPQTTQGNLLDRAARSFGQPALDLTRRVEDEWRRTGQPPELGFTEQLGVLGMMPMGPFGTVRPGLDMSQAARLARAREMGFDTNEVLYHGTRSQQPFEAFDLNRVGTGSGVPNEAGIFLTPSHRLASNFASYYPGQMLGHVMPLYARPGRQLTLGPDELPQYARLSGQNRPYMIYAPEAVSEAIGRARATGYDSIRLRRVSDNDIIADQVVVLDPRNLRSINAAFDPSRAGSPNLMYGISAPIAGGAVAASLSGDQR